MQTSALTPRLTGWLLFATVLNLLVLLVAGGNQSQVVLYKIALVTTFAWLGYWFDRAIAPYARPADFFPCITTADSLVAAAAMLRRAVIILAFVIGGGLGL